MAGRTVTKWMRAQMDGYELSGYLDSAGPLTWAFDMPSFVAFSDAAKGYLPNLANMELDTVTGIFDTTATTGLHVTASGATGNVRTVSIALGSLAAPTLGDPAFSVQAIQTTYNVPAKDGMVPVALKFKNAETAVPVGYSIPWGTVLQWNTARTAVNSSAGTDNLAAAATSFGGYMVYHVSAGNGTATLSVDDSADNSTGWATVSGMTTGSIDCATVRAGMVAIGNTATIKRYTRHQIALGTATSVTFSLIIVRAYHA